MKRSTCSIRDLAEYVNVSPSTVSRVLNNKKSNVSITDATRRKIMRAAKKLNYTPNIHAKRLFGNKTNIIGLLVPSYERLGMHIFEDNHLVRIISGLEKSLRVHQYNLLLLFNDNDFVPQKRYLQLFREKQIDGLLIWGALEDDDYWDELRDSGFPYLFLVNAPSEMDKFNHIVVDPYKATCEITDILLDKGHREIAWIRGRDDIALTRCQARAIDDTFKRAGLSADNLTILDGDYSIDSGRCAVRQLLDNKSDCTAIITSNDTMGAGGVSVLNENNLRVPEDIALASLDSAEGLNEFNMSMLTAKVSDVQMGEEAGKSIISLINNEVKEIRKSVKMEVYPGKTV